MSFLAGSLYGVINIPIEMLRDYSAERDNVRFLYVCGMDRIHIWSDDSYGSNVFLRTFPTPTHGLKVKVADLEVYSC